MSGDRDFMLRALALAEKGLYTTDPNPRVGCVIVDGDEIVGEGFHRRAGGPHAEIEALTAAGQRARGATVYVTLEPCCHVGRTAPCTDALIEAGVARVVAASQDPHPVVDGSGFERLRAAEIAVDVGLCSDEAEGINPGFFARHRRGRPWVRVKTAMSLDARTALADGASKWITGPEARRDGHLWRARSSAILTGIGTLLADDPRLTVRRDDVDDFEPPDKVLLDPQLRCPPDAKLLDRPGTLRIFTAAPRESAEWKTLEERGAVLTRFEAGDNGRLDLESVLTELAGHEVNELLVEAGATLTGALIAAGFVDEWIVYVAPKVLGPSARGIADVPTVAEIARAYRFEFADCTPFGEDLRFTARARR